MLLIDKHKLKQKCNNFGYLSTQFWLKGNDKKDWQYLIQFVRNYAQVWKIDQWLAKKDHSISQILMATTK